MKKNLPFVLVMACLLAIAVLAGFKICAIVRDYRTGEDTAEALQQYIQLPTQPPETQPREAEAAPMPEETLPAPTEPPVVYPEVDFAALQEKNTDIIAWIYIPDTNINYPMVQGEDNRKYLNVMPDGTPHFSGSIFMDYRCEADFSDPHTILYGHNIQNGTMFNQIRKYMEPEFYAEHPTGMIMTPDGNFRFEVIAGYIARTTDPAWRVNFNWDGEFETWLRDTMDRSTIGGTVTPTEEDRILTLSTCTYEFDRARYVLICRIIP